MNRLLDRAGQAAGLVVNDTHRIIGEQGVCAAGSFEGGRMYPPTSASVPGGDVKPQLHPLVQCRHVTHAQVAPEGGLA